MGKRSRRKGNKADNATRTRRAKHSKLVRLPGARVREYERLSPFEFKNVLIRLAEGDSPGQMMNAGRGNPNFFNTFAREIFGRLQIGCSEMSHAFKKDLALYPNKNEMDFAATFRQMSRSWPADQRGFMRDYIGHLVSLANEKGDDPQFILHDLFLSSLGTFYPSPPQIQPHLQLMAEEYMHRLVGGPTMHVPPQGFEYFATEGAAAGIMYVFNTLRANYMLRPGDKIAVVTPIFSPYLEMPFLKGPQGYDLEVVELRCDPGTNYSLPVAEIRKLKNKSIKALFMVNPANPGSYSLSKENIDAIGNLINQERRDLIVLSDNVYAPFADEYHSFMTVCPRNTIEVFSLSKFFGTTGCRLGLVMVAKNNNFLNVIDALPDAERKALAKRYQIATLTPNSLTFMQRLVFDSRQVAEAHVGGLSTIQQVLIGLMFYYVIHDSKGAYLAEIKGELLTRIRLLYKRLGVPFTTSPEATHYYSMVNLLDVARSVGGSRGAKRLAAQTNYIEFLVRLAKEYHVVLLPGAGFGSDKWYVRVSLANLPLADYGKIGKAVRDCVSDFLRG